MSNTKGEMKIPIGFRFRPTDEELVVHYLKRRVLSLPIPASVVIPDLNAFNFHPCSLPGNLKEKIYYFWKSKRDLGNKLIMSTSCGIWKVIGKIKQIVSIGAINDVVGTRKTWAFYQINSQIHGHWSKTRWVMHEFRLPDSTTKNETYGAKDWAVCRVFQRKMKHKSHGKIVPKYICCDNNSNNYLANENQSSFEFKLESNFDKFGPPQPLSPCSTIDS